MLCEWKGDIFSKNKKSQQKIPLTHHRLWRGNSRLSRRFAWYSRSPCGTCWEWASLGSTYGLLHSCLQVGKVKDQSIPKGKSSQIVFTIDVVCHRCLHYFPHPATPTSKTGSGSGAFGRVAKTTSPASPPRCFSKWYFYIKTLQGSLHCHYPPFQVEGALEAAHWREGGCLPFLWNQLLHQSQGGKSHQKS